MLDADRSGDQPDRSSQPGVCPYLGLPDDPRTRFSFADPAHRCHARTKPVQIDLGHQGAYCLAAEYPTCKRFPTARTAERPATSPEVDPGTPTGRRRGRALERVASVIVVLVVVALLAVLGVGSINGFKGGLLGGFGSNDVAAPPSTAPSPTAKPTSTPTPTATPAPTPSATATPTPTPTVVPSPSRFIYVVAGGDTLDAIAERFGVTRGAIQDANGIVNPNLIVVGQKLVIPPPP